MPRPNPLSGPAYVIALRNALEKRPSSEYQEAPRTGGTQVSISWMSSFSTTSKPSRRRVGGIEPKFCTP